MPAPIEVMARRVADRLATAENLANQSLHGAAGLMQSMMDLRLETDIAPYEGQLAVMRVQAAIAKITEAQADLAKAHKAMRSDFTRITMIPDNPERCPISPSGLAEVEAA